MANKDRPRGLVPVSHLIRGTFNGEYRIYYLPAGDGTDTFIGDGVALAGSADASGRYPSIAQATAGTGNPMIGAVVGFGTNPQIMAQIPDLSIRYRVGSTAMYVAVVDDPYVIFQIQEVSGGVALTIAAVGNNTPYVVGSGSTTTGMSGGELNNAGEVSTTEQLRILRLDPAEDNVLGEHAKWWTLINEHQMKEAAGV